MDLLKPECRDRIITVDERGKAQCHSCKAIADVPSDFIGTLKALSSDLELAMDCMKVFKGIPLPVAKAILRNLEPALAAIDMCVRMAENASIEKVQVH